MNLKNISGPMNFRPVIYHTLPRKAKELGWENFERWGGINVYGDFIANAVYSDFNLE